MHKLIMLSDTYQQSSRTNEAGRRVDADSRLLWRFPSRRRAAEAIRDSILFVSGNLNFEVGGPGFSFFKSRGGLTGFPPVTEFTQREFRRMIYQHKIRMEPVPIFGAFDAPDAGQTMPRRKQSTTAIQALNLFNSPFVNDQATAFANRITKETGDDTGQKVTHAFQFAFGRTPNPVEAKAAIATAEFHIANSFADGIPFWDTGAPGVASFGKIAAKASDPYNDIEPLDSSAAAICGQGYLRLGNYLLGKGDATRGKRYRAAAFTIAQALLAEPYMSTDTKHQGITLHAIYHRPNNWDYIPKGRKIPCGESAMWGDYHTMELISLIQREAENAPYPLFFQ